MIGSTTWSSPAPVPGRPTALPRERRYEPQPGSVRRERGDAPAARGGASPPAERRPGEPREGPRSPRPDPRRAPAPADGAPGGSADGVGHADRRRGRAAGTDVHGAVGPHRRAQAGIRTGRRGSEPGPGTSRVADVERRTEM